MSTYAPSDPPGSHRRAIAQQPASTTAPFRYVAFGLSIASEFEIHEFLSDDAVRTPADVTIRRGAVDHPGPTVDEFRGLHVTDEGDIYLQLEIGDVVIRGGAEVVVDLVPDVDAELLRWYLVGSVFNHLLYQRGFLVLHASTVQVGDEAICFLGESTAGKSTTALALFGEGYPVLADDVAAITFEGDRPYVQPGFPALKLDAPSLAALSAPLEALPGQSPELERHFYRSPGEYATSPLPLARIYCLDDGPRTEIVPVESGDALMRVIAETYTNLEIEGVESAMTNLEQCGRVARSVPVKLLRRRYVRSAIPSMVAAVVDDLAEE